MKLKGPYLTLAGGLTVAAVLLSLSTTATKKDDLAVAAAGAVTAPAASGGAAKKPATEAPKPAAKPTPPGTYAGSVKGGGASVAIAVKGKTAIAYVCDGEKVEAWMQGSAKSTALSLKGKDGAVLTAKYTKGKLSGTVRTAGKEWSFGVKTVKAPSGLYRSARNVRTAKVVGGWIVYEGKQVGMLDTSGVETPAPPINLTTGTVTINGTSVPAAPVDGSPID
jgi:serine/threonine-protein kinase